MKKLMRDIEKYLLERYVLRVRPGPVMIQRRGYWLFVDHYGRLFRLDYTGEYENSPLIITMVER